MARTAIEAASMSRTRRSAVRASWFLAMPREVGHRSGRGVVHAEPQRPPRDGLLRHRGVEPGAELEVLPDERLARPLELAALDVLAERGDLDGHDTGEEQRAGRQEADAERRQPAPATRRRA